MSALYTPALLRLATRTLETPPIEGAQSRGEARSRTCGGRMVVTLDRDAAGRIVRYGHDVHACAVGQAAATLFAGQATGHATGLTDDDVAKGRAVVADWVAGVDDDLGQWSAFAVLGGARFTPARHGAILLPFDATLAALARVAA